METFGKYEVIERVGRGGFGEVFLARDPVLGRTVAIKTCLSPQREVRDRFFREARIAGNLQHPNIVVVHELGMTGSEVPYLVQEFVEGRDLRDVIREGRPDLGLAFEWLAATARALAYAHFEGVVHRDVKPANVRIGEGGIVKLLDFGVARLLEAATKLTRTGETVGTIAYVPPEMLEGRPASPRSDVFSWGVMAYELLTGRRPFGGDSVSRIMLEILTVEPPPPNRVVSCPSRLSELVVDCLHKEPEHRCPSFEEVVTRLRRARRQWRREGTESRSRSSSERRSRRDDSEASGDPDTDLTLTGSSASIDSAFALFEALRDGLERDGDA